MTIFRVGAADPPWKCGDQLPGKKRGASKHYRLMPTDDIAAMPYERKTTFEFPRFYDDSIMFLWRLAAMQDDALYVLQQWKFMVKAEVVWAKYFPCKDCGGVGRGTDRYRRDWSCEACDGTGCGTPAFGMGHYTRAAHEICLIAVRGKMASRITSHSVRSMFHAPMPVGVDGKVIHSAKPARFYADVVEKLSGGPYVEMFARAQRRGWTCLGNQARRKRA